MWLVPVLSLVSRLVASIYYRFRVVGRPAARTGPVLLVANHPNALLDPALVVAAAGRPVRFFAKSTLFEDRRIGWLVRAAGAIPVYRRIDHATARLDNVEAFAAAHQALADGCAVGIFPEGTSHSAPALARLKTGTARIALGAVPRTGRDFPIQPLGLVLRDKGVFRSEALAVLGDPLSWDDLAGRGGEDREAVHELTERLERGLRRVTVNLEAWEDRPLIEWAEAVWSAERRAEAAPDSQLERISAAAAILARLRRRGDSTWEPLARRVAGHRRRLSLLGLEPADLGVDTTLAGAGRWTVRRLHLLGPPALAVAVAGWVLFWPPYRLTALVSRPLRLSEELRSTYKVLLGGLIHSLWVLALALVAGGLAGGWACLAALVMVPAVGAAGLRVRERWSRAWSDARRFFLLRSRRALLAQLRAQQRELYHELEDLYQAWRRGDLGGR